MKKRGFTLIELLIVTVVIVTLMGIVFRLSGSGIESKKRSETIVRLQKLANALSGYYAAFGSYPPVPLQGRSRDIYTEVDNSGSLGYGIQGSGQGKTSLDANQIEAACRAQPVAAGYPYNPETTREVFQQLSEDTGKTYRPIDSGDYGHFRWNSSKWSENHVFMFGLMSFLLPRYQFMLDGASNLYTMSPNGPWESNNRLPYMLDGERLKSWGDAQKYLRLGEDYWNLEYSNLSDEEKAKGHMIENLPSQSVCARWMPNLAGIVAGGGVFFGVDTREPKYVYINDESKLFRVFAGGHGGGKDEACYINGVMTVRDGWGNDLYYCSFPPYQSYQLWSAGPNERTFPPWLEPKSGDKSKVNGWIADDIKVGDK